jgi:hypothetical protein
MLATQAVTTSSMATVEVAVASDPVETPTTVNPTPALRR